MLPRATTLILMNCKLSISKAPSVRLQNFYLALNHYCFWRYFASISYKNISFQILCSLIMARTRPWLIRKYVRSCRISFLKRYFQRYGACIRPGSQNSECWTTDELPLFNNKRESTDNHEIIPLNSTSNLLLWKKYKFQMREY